MAKTPNTSKIENSLQERLRHFCFTGKTHLETQGGKLTLGHHDDARA